MPDKNFTPVQFKGVMVSSTFIDLESHRKELMRALRREELFAIGMEEYISVPGDDIISSSLEMVRKSSAYIGLISRRYGQVVESPTRNPNSFSISRLEFEEAQRLGLPTLIFIMGEDHIVKESEVEIDPINREKLKAYRERAKEGRIYVNFNSLEDFTKEAIHNVSKLAEHLKEENLPPVIADTPSENSKSEANPIPVPPAFYAEPSYIGSHDFVGREAELERLSDWAVSADPHPVLLFEAIGGTGKSMLTWQWANEYATKVRKDWAGIFWYSFYEKGAIMTDFCQRALAYITRKPLEEFRKKKIAELSEQLLRHLQARPWLFILDGLERVLVAYHRFDAAQIADDQVDSTEDQIAKRDPYSAIRPEDDDLLRTLAAATRSKLLITTRLTPRILLSPSSQGIQGVLRVPLPGLRPADAEKLILSCGITGTSQIIQDYLKSHCDCHPLVTGILAGLINDYLPNRGNFDAWASDKTGGGQLNLANLDLVQKRNHILLAAITALPDKSRQLLSTLALISESVDFLTLSALNPHLSPEPEKVTEPSNPEEDAIWWNKTTKAEKKAALEYYRDRLQEWEKYKEALSSQQQVLPFATQELTKTVRDLERRGLLQYDHQSKRYDLHPVVRGVAAGRLGQEDKERYGQRVVDHFSQQTHIPYEEAETYEDVRYGLQVVRALLQMGRYEQAFYTYLNGLNVSLLFNLEEYDETLSILQAFFPQGWSTFTKDLYEGRASLLANDAALVLERREKFEEALECYNAAISSCVKRQDFHPLIVILKNVSGSFHRMNRLAKMERFSLLALDLASLLEGEEDLFVIRLWEFWNLSALGRFAEAESIWQLLNPKGINFSRSSYRLGEAEVGYAWFHFFQGTLKEEFLAHAEQLAIAGKNRPSVHRLHFLRGKWRIEQEQWGLAAESLHEALRMSRETRQDDKGAEAMLCLAKFHLGQLLSPQDEAERLAKTKEPSHYWLAKLWLAIEDRRQAKKYALAAYKSAWADGEPYVYRYELNKARALLEQLGVEIPDLPPYDPSKDEKLPWEDDVAAAIEKLRAEKLAEADNKNIQE